MNLIHSRQSSVNSSRSRRALVQTRLLLAAMGLSVGGVAFFATAQTGRPPVKMTSGNAGSSSKPKTWADLPALIEAYGQSRSSKSQKKSSTPGSTSSARAIGTGQSGFNLVETDLTTNSSSDDREPIVSPGGDFIAFASDGKDTNGDGRLDSDGFNTERKYHIWVMNRDGSDQRQVTGLFDDKARNQRRPSWSPDGNELVYVDGDGGGSELFVAEPFTDGDGGVDGVQATQPTRRTFFNPDLNVTLRSPAWSPNGQVIIFAANANLDNSAGVVGRPFNLFSISPTGETDSIVRLTGGANDTTVGASQTTTVDDYNPAFSAINSDVIYFSSNRDRNGVLGVRRIWRIFADGSAKVQVTDPTRRANGRAGDSDDFPSASLSGSSNFLTNSDVPTEGVAFQTNSLIDSSDVTPDLNIWSLPLSSAFPVPFEETAPRIFISNFSGNRVEVQNPLNGQPNVNYQALDGLRNPEGIVVQGQYVYVADRGSNQIRRFDQETGVPVRGFFNSNSFSDPAAPVPVPSGLISDGNFFYVAAGIGAATKNTTAIYRYNFFGGSAGNGANNSAQFSFALPGNPEGVTDGAEGLTFSAGNNSRYIFASIVGDAKVNVYDRVSGQFIKTFVATGAGGLSFPTDLTFGPDLNKDGYQDLYVNSSGSDDVLAYAGPNPGDLNALVGAGSDVAPGAPLGAVVSDTEGTVTDLNAPEGIDVFTDDNGLIQIFVSSFQNRGNNNLPGTGNHLNRYTLDPSTINTADPTTLIAQSAPSFFATRTPGVPRPANYLTFANPGGLTGVGYFDFNQLARQSLISRTGMPAPTPTPIPDTNPLEGDGSAKLQTNILSSPSNYSQSGIQPPSGVDNVGEDKAEDVEPAFSRTSATAESASRLAFASTRRFAPLPSSNLPNGNGNAPTPSNPFGEGTGGTHDIWSASTVDTTPPALIPQASGNQLLPVVAPGPQSPFPAPRTAETGLRPGGNVTVAVVLSELESGIDEIPGAITADFFRAGREQFTQEITNVNEAVPVSVRTEGRPPVEKSLTLQPYDDGPAPQGHEMQAGAVSGDGIYYCVGTTTTSTSAGDFYIDIDAVDRVGNAFTYDNVWGFSTKTFVKQSDTSNLFVSDYTTGQQFPYLLNNNDFVQDTRFENEMSVESYYLANNGGQVTDPTIVGNTSSVPSTFSNVDVWRVLSRGAVPATTINGYKPRVTQQIDIVPTKDPTFTQKTRDVTVADNFIIWAAPFAANSFVGPGTITDATTQSNLTNFLEAGGRLFVTGRDVAFALSTGASTSNSFLSDELGASFAGEVANNNIDLVGDTENGLIRYLARPYADTYYDLQIADRIRNNANIDNLFTDGALTQQPHAVGIGHQMDTLTPAQGATAIYAVGGATVAQKFARQRNNGLESRVVFFGFGLEGINRRYRKPTGGFPLVALDTRARIASGLAAYFKTNTVKGQVINDKTNLPIPNFLVRVQSGQDVYLARTDEKGNYQLTGLPAGVYGVEPAFLLNGRLVARNTPGAQTNPSGFFAGTTSFAQNLRTDVADDNLLFNTNIIEGGVTGTANLRPIPLTPGSISGRVVTSKGTPNDFVDDVKLFDGKSVGMTVLLRSISETSSTKNGGRYAQIIKTSFNGSFTFSNVPAGVPMEVVFNPRKDDPNTSAYEGDIPKEANLDGSYAGPKPDVGRRVIPDARRAEPIAALIGSTYFLNDPDPVKFNNPETGPAAGSADADKPANSGVPIVVPEGTNVSGIVTLNGTPLAGAKVELLDSKGAKLNPERTRTTDSSGRYSFTEILSGTYLVRVTTTLPDGLEVTKTSAPITTAVKDVVVDFPLFLAKVTGLVTRNGQPQAGASVQLLDANGKSVVINQTGGPFTLVRTTTTDKGTKANYTLTNVPPGRYTVRASFGDASGSVVVTVTNTRDAVAPNINLVPQNLTGVVNLRIDGVSKGGLAGADVELLNTSGNSLNPRVVTGSGVNGVFGFGSVAAGTYKVRASYKGDTDISGTFTVNAGATSKQTLNIDLQTVTVTVFGPQGTPQAAATVSLLRGTTVLQTATTDNNGVVKFTEIAAGTYTITAASNGLSQSVSAVVVERQALAVSLQLFNTTFGNNGVFPISLPFSTDSIGVTVDQAFNLPLSSKAYKIFYFDVANQVNKPRINTSTQIGDFKEIVTGTTRLERGKGYVLQTFDTPISIRTPQQNSALKPFIGTTFTIPLSWNNTYLSKTGERDNRNNGYNLIGFPFDPARYRTVNFAEAQVMYGNTLYKTLAEAVAAGVISQQVYTLNAAGVRVTTSDSNFKPFVGYFVRIQRNDQPVKLILRNPK